MSVIDECRLGGNPIRTPDGANLPVNLVYDFTSDLPLALDLDHANRPALAPLQLRELGIATKELFLTFFTPRIIQKAVVEVNPKTPLFCILQFRCGLR